MESDLGFVCAECGYIALVRGKHYVAEQEHRMTVQCQECRSLADIVVSRKVGEEWKPLPLECAQVSSHHLEPWLAGGHCPRCGGRMWAAEPKSPSPVPEDS